MTTVICLDDYHCLDRYGRKDKVLLVSSQPPCLAVPCMSHTPDDSASVC